MTLGPLVLALDLIGSLPVAWGVAAALAALLRGEGLDRARLLAADGALAGLSFKVAATLLKTLELQTWAQIGAFAAIFALRTLLKGALAFDRRQALAGKSSHERA